MYTTIVPNPLSLLINDTPYTLGKLTVIEGPDGSGKTTLIKELVEVVRAADKTPIVIRFPDNRRNNHLPFRQMIMSEEMGRHPSAEPFLFMADFIYTFDADVIPLLSDPNVIFLFDRFIPSTCIYQEISTTYVLKMIESMRFDTFRQILPTMDYIYLTPPSAEEHIKRLGNKQGWDLNRLDPKSVDESHAQRDKYADFARAHQDSPRDFLPAKSVTILTL